MLAPADDSVFSKDNPFPALITENRLLSRSGSAKETRHFVVDLAGSGMSYKAGDSLGVYPTNRPEEVVELLRLLDATGEEPVTLPRTTETAALRDALAGKLSLAGPTRKVIEDFAARATHAAEKARLSGLLAPESKDVLAGFLYERQFADLLAEFPSARPAPQEFVNHLRRLMPRLYSIASSPKAHPGETHLTVAIVRYRTNSRDRVGVCSTFLSDRANVGLTRIPVFVSHSHFAPPADGSRDCIMVGPGTGIAPFRAFVQDRIADGAKGRNWIFFGDQHRATDFLYEEEWLAHAAGGAVTRLDLAWSRDQAHKIYVQDLMRQNAAEIWSWIDGGAHFYVCGDAKRMAKDVDTALHDIACEQGKLAPDKAAEFVRQLRKDKRYQRDVY